MDILSILKFILSSFPNDESLSKISYHTFKVKFWDENSQNIKTWKQTIIWNLSTRRENNIANLNITGTNKKDL